MLLQDFLRDIGTAAADAIVMASVGAYGFDDYLGISNLLRQEMAAWNAGVPQPCLSEHCYHELEKAYIDAMVSNYLKVLCLPEHLACTLWEYLDEPLVDGARERIRERYSGELPARVMYASSKLKWRDGAETPECRCEFSDEALSGWVLQVPCAHETTEYAKTAKFHALNEGVKLRIAALFLLLSDYELDPTAGEKRVVVSRALEQLEEWET